jgi:murein L,D-transpeptidase YcbB/YkuD
MLAGRLGGTILLALAAGWAGPAGAAEALEVAHEIESRLIEPALGWSPGVPAPEPRVADFYRARDFRPLWLEAGRPSPRASQAVTALAAAGRDGLNPDDYAVTALLQHLEAGNAAEIAELELLLSSSVVRFASDLRTGRTSPAKFARDLYFLDRRLDVPIALQRVAGGDPSQVLIDLAPANPYYRRLKRALAEYREHAHRGGWPRLDDHGKLELGMSGPGIEQLKAVLLATRDLPAPLPTGEPFGPALELALQRFQRRHGLASDGVVGPRTRAAMNVPVEERIRQIVINMERWRWLPDDLGDRYVLVNMAGFELELVESEHVALYMRVIVGKTYRRSPVFSDRIRYLEINPTWTVPPKIAAVDLLPKIRKDPLYFGEQGIRVFSDWGAGARELLPAAIDWSRYGKGRFPFKLRQDPGPKNALGRVKFMFPNKYDVYLHDTPSPELFQREVRTLSSGCIRVEKPLELALRLLDGHEGWDREKLALALAGGRQERVNLPQPVPVHLTYSTAWIGEGGDVHFRDDVYGRDRPLLAALFPR